MATKTLIPVEEYLRTGFEGPEPDFVEGELVERAMPNAFHSEIQRALIQAFGRWQGHDLYCYPEIRMRLGEGRYRVADVALYSSRQREAIPSDVPLAVFEIVSPDDRYSDLRSKLDDYERAGIGHIYVIEPPLRKLSRYRHGDLATVHEIELSGEIRVPAPALFDEP